MAAADWVSLGVFFWGRLSHWVTLISKTYIFSLLFGDSLKRKKLLFVDHSDRRNTKSPFRSHWRGQFFSHNNHFVGQNLENFQTAPKSSSTMLNDTLSLRLLWPIRARATFSHIRSSCRALEADAPLTRPDVKDEALLKKGKEQRMKCVNYFRGVDLFGENVSQILAFALPYPDVEYSGRDGSACAAAWCDHHNLSYLDAIDAMKVFHQISVTKFDPLLLAKTITAN